MIRETYFEIPNAEAAAELIKLGTELGWSAGPVYNYVAGEPFLTGDPRLDVQPFVPESTCSTVALIKEDFNYDELDSIYAKADDIAAKVGGEVTGGGTCFSESKSSKIEELRDTANALGITDVIPFKEDAQPIVDYIISQVGEDLPGMRDQAMEIRKLLVEAGWTPPVSPEDFAV